MNEKDKQRIHKSALEKRKALIEISQGIKAKNAISKDSEDKKYANKMVHKWKKEKYSKKLDLSRDGLNFDDLNIDVDFELSTFNFQSENELDIFLKAEKEHKKGLYIKRTKGFAIYSDLCKLYEEQNK